MKLVQLPRDGLLKPLQAVTGYRRAAPYLAVYFQMYSSNAQPTHCDLLLPILSCRSPTSCILDKKTGEEQAITVSARKLVDILRRLAG